MCNRALTDARLACDNRRMIWIGKPRWLHWKSLPTPIFIFQNIPESLINWNNKEFWDLGSECFFWPFWEIDNYQLQRLRITIQFWWQWVGDLGTALDKYTLPTLPKTLVNGEKMTICKTTSAPWRTRDQNKCYMETKGQQTRQFCHQECSVMEIASPATHQK